MYINESRVLKGKNIGQEPIKARNENTKVNKPSKQKK